MVLVGLDVLPSELDFVHTSEYVYQESSTCNIRALYLN